MIKYKQIKCSLNDIPKKGNYHFIDLFGNQYWYVDGVLHRDNDEPAIIWADGTQCWYQHGKRHRDNDLPASIDADGTKYWYQYDNRHRDNDLPAIINVYNSQCWYQNKQHRINNPAVIKTNGYVEYWYDDIQYTKQEYFDLMLAKGLISEKEYFVKIL